MSFGVTAPAVLWLLPATVLPWIRHPLRSFAHPHLALLPADALSDAVASVADHKICPRLDAPATLERVLMVIERLKAGA